MADEKNIRLVLQQQETEEKPLLRINTLWKQAKRFFVLWIVVSIVAALGVGAFAMVNYSDTMETQAMVEFSFKGIESGKDPYGNNFDITKLKSPAVIEAALTAQGISKEDVPVDVVRNALTIGGVRPEDAIEKMVGYQSIIDMGNTNALSALKEFLNVTYFPTKFVITLQLDNTDLEPEQGAALLDAILESYKQYFFQTYGYNDALGSAVLSVDYNDYDYERVIEVFDSTLASAQSYLNTLAAEDDTGFRSATTGYSFRDLSSAINTLRTEDLDWINSYVTVNNVTKDKGLLLTYYDYRIQSLERAKTAAQEKLVAIDESIAAYQKDTILVMNNENGKDMTVSQSSGTYDSMIQQKINMQSQIAEYTRDISYYTSRSTSLRTTTTTVTNAQIKMVDERIANLYTKVETLIDQVNVTADEYYENVAYANAFTVLVPANVPAKTGLIAIATSSVFPVVIVECLILVVYVMVVVCTAFAKDQRISSGIASSAQDTGSSEETEAQQQDTAKDKKAQKK